MCIRDSHKLSRAYSASLEDQEDIDGIRTALLHLVAHDKKTTYQTRKAWINPENKTVLKEERFAKSGKKLKRILFKDLLKENTQTTYKFDVIEFNVEIPARYFSQSILKRQFLSQIYIWDSSDRKRI